MRTVTSSKLSSWMGILALVGTSWLVGCGHRGSTDFSEAIPESSLVTMDVPGATVSSSTASSSLMPSVSLDRALQKGVMTDEVDSAGCYDGTVDLATRANYTVKYVLTGLDTITDYRYTVIGENTYQWGPWEDADSGLTKRLIVTEEVTGGYSYSYDAAVTGTEEFLTLILGEIEAGSTRTAGSGNFVVNLDALEALEQTGEKGGVLTFDYSQDELKNRHIHVGLSDYLFSNGERDDAILDFTGNADGTGLLDWTRNRNVYDDGAGEALKEDLTYRSRWTAEHSGRCDGKTNGGDLNTNVITAHQCWDVSTAEVYFQNELNDEVYTTRGDASKCSFSDISYAEFYSGE